MTDWSKTAVLVAAAGVLAGLVYLTRPVPKEAALISDQGQPLAPALKDPLEVRSLEVISYDEAAAKTRAFKVAFDGKRWIIPSHQGYPADAAEKVAQAASAFADLIKERFVTENKTDHAALGLLSPDDESALTTATGTGTRVTLRDASDRPLVDLVIGKPVKTDAATPFEQTTAKRYVREAGQNRVYVTTLAAGFSTKFADWVVTDLLQTTSDQVTEVAIDRYQVDPERGLTKEPAHLALKKESPPTPPPADPTAPPAAPPQPTWSLTGTPQGGPGPDEVLNKTRVDEMLTALTQLKIVGVRAKPANLAKVLGGASAEVRLGLPDQISLSSRGFYLVQSRLLANEGQMTVRCTDGVVYSLWFGEAVPDSEDAASGGQVGGASDAGAAPKTPGASNARYMMITVSHDAAADPEPKKPESLVSAEAAFAKTKADFEAAHPKPASPEETKPADAQPAEPKPAADPAPPPPAEPPSAADEAPKEPPELMIQRQQHEAAVNAWKARTEAAKKRADTLSKRFADWYYVISSESLNKVRPTRDQLVSAPLAAPATPPTAPGDDQSPPPASLPPPEGT